MSKVIICGVNTATLPKLNGKESNELLVKIASGDEGAREKFIISNMRLVLSVIKRFKLSDCNLDDVFQAGVIGLIKAVDNFDIKYNVKFSTYAVPMIIGEVKRFIKSGNSLKIARSIRDTAYQVLKARSELEKGGEECTVSQIAERLNIKEKEVVYALDAISDTVSIYEPVYNKSGDELLLLDQLGDEKNTDERWTEEVALTLALNDLESREKKIIYLRYYEGKTQTEISNEVGISQAQVSRLEKNALKQIRNRVSVF